MSGFCNLQTCGAFSDGGLDKGTPCNTPDDPAADPANLSLENNPTLTEDSGEGDAVFTGDQSVPALPPGVAAGAAPAPARALAALAALALAAAAL